VFPKIVAPKYMVKIMENPIKMDDLGGKPTIFGNIHIASNLEISRHWSQEFDFFEFCGAISALKPWGVVVASV